MKQSHALVGLVGIAVLGGIAWYAQSQSGATVPVVVAAAAATPTLVEPAHSEASPAPAPMLTVTPSPTPAAVANVMAAARKTPLNRPMTEIAKNWFGCKSEDAYNTTMDLLTHNDPASAERFKGADAACVALAPGQAIKLVDIDTSNNVAQVRVTETQAVLWTDAAALSGHGQHGSDTSSAQKP